MADHVPTPSPVPERPRRRGHPNQIAAGRATALKRFGVTRTLHIGDLPPADREVAAAIIAAIRAKRAEQRAQGGEG